eukprot:scaffold269000_cov14-Tisochrysis_lutea.AAC.1
MLPGPIRALRRVQSKAISKVKGYPSSNASGPTQSKVSPGRKGNVSNNKAIGNVKEHPSSNAYGAQHSAR